MVSGTCVRNSDHNHGASEDMSGHAVARRLNVEQVRSVEKMYSAGVSARQICLPFVKTLKEMHRLRERSIMPQRD